MEVLHFTWLLSMDIHVAFEFFLLIISQVISKFINLKREDQESKNLNLNLMKGMLQEILIFGVVIFVIFFGYGV